MEKEIQASLMHHWRFGEGQRFTNKASQALSRIDWKPRGCSIHHMSLHASAATKRSISWIGDKAHFSETCDEDLPRLITQVTTTIGPIPDRHALPEIHEVLDQRELLSLYWRTAHPSATCGDSSGSQSVPVI